MKKFLIFLMAAIFCFGLFGCASPLTEENSEVPEEVITEHIGDNADLLTEEAENAEGVSAVDPQETEQYRAAAQNVVGEWVAFARYEAASNALILKEDGTGSYGGDPFTWSVNWVEEPHVTVECCGDDGAVTYYLNFMKFDEDPVWRCDVTLVNDFADETNFSVVHEDEEGVGQRYNRDALEIIEITADNFTEYFDIRPEASWTAHSSGKADFDGRWYYVFLRPEYAERIAYSESVIKLKYFGQKVYYQCDVDFENAQCTIGAPFPEIKTEDVDKTAAFDLNNNFGPLFPGEYCAECLDGGSGNGILHKSTGDVYYTAVLEDFVIEECAGQLILAK